MFRTRNEARGTEPQELSIRWQCTWRRTAAILASLTIRGSSDVANVTEALHCKLRLETLATAKTIAERKVVQEDYPYLIPMLSDPSCDHHRRVVHLHDWSREPVVVAKVVRAGDGTGAIYHGARDGRDI